MNKLEQAARQVIANGVQGTYAKYYSVPPADFESLREALAEQAEQEPVRFVWNGEGWIEADEYLWKTTPDAERRELYAAPQPDMNLNCKSVQKRLATSWGYVKAEQAEQEPVAWVWLEDWLNDGYPEDCFSRVNHQNKTPLYAAPVRTKDLTASEIRDIWNSSDTYDVFCVEFARAVISADREKNNV